MLLLLFLCKRQINHRIELRPANVRKYKQKQSVRLQPVVYERLQSNTIARGGSMSKGLQIVKENNNLAEWSRQVEECRNSGLSVRSWCEQHQIAVSTFHYRQQKVWKALQKSSQFVEVPLSFNESHNNNIAASVKVGSIELVK